MANTLSELSCLIYSRFSMIIVNLQQILYSSKRFYFIRQGQVKRLKIFNCLKRLTKGCYNLINALVVELKKGPKS